MEFSKNFIVGLSFGKDMIPRLGRPQLENLMNELVENLTECQENKWRVILFGKKKPVKKNLPPTFDANLSHSDSKNSRTVEAQIPASHPTNLTSEIINDADSSTSLKSSLRTRTHRRNVSNLRTRERIFLPTANNTEIDKTEDMFPAGQQHHISQDYELGQVDQSFYDDILIGARMMYDHFPNSLLYAVMAQQSLEQVKKLNRIFKNKVEVIRSVKPFVVKAGSRVEGSLLIRDENFIALNKSYENKMISFKFNVFDVTATPLKIDKAAGKNSKSPKNYSKALNMAVYKMEEDETADFEAPFDWFFLDDSSVQYELNGRNSIERNIINTGNNTNLAFQTSHTSNDPHSSNNSSETTLLPPSPEPSSPTIKFQVILNSLKKK